MALRPTPDVASRETLIELFGADADFQPAEAIQVCAGEWRKEPAAEAWRFWEDTDFTE